MLKTTRLLTIILTLAAFLGAQTAGPAMARQEPAPSEEVITSPDPDEASAEAATPDEQNQPQNTAPGSQAMAPPGASIPDGAGFEARIRASAAAAEGLQGPLDGGWTIRGEGGEALYGLQLVDKNGGDLEGAWRDVRRVGAVGARGLVANMVLVGDELTLRFYPREGGDAVVLTVHAFGDNIWSGSLFENGAETPVSLVRNEARPTGDYSGVPRGPVLPPGYTARSHRSSGGASASRHHDNGKGRSKSDKGKGKKGKGGSGKGGSGGKGKSKGGGGSGKSGGSKGKGGSGKSGSGKSGSGKSGGKKKKH